MSAPSTTPSSPIGVHLRRADSASTLAFARKADAAGIGTGWLTLGGPAFDSLTLFGATATATEQLHLGTSIVPAFIQHPVKLATQARTIEELAPGRLRLGIGTSHGPSMGTLGIPIDRPLDRLREYLRVIRPLLHDGAVEFAGDFYDVKLTAPNALGTPVLVSALRENAWRLAGELSDGGISWVSPLDYLVDQMKPVLLAGAAAAGRAAPPLIAHVSIAPGVSREEARALGREQLAVYPRLPFYRAMFADSGWPLAEGDTEWPTDLLDHLVVSGSDDEIGETLRHWLDRGVDELLVSPLLPAGAGTQQDDRVLAILAAAASSGR
ncbi:MAG TPA: LLM class flavin-dependent oxidoreductase [Thermomicrobiales bacterium]|nr:LLM class flavin-dependent oxidoreductase [Thermomicrobiales bacterium]